MPPQPVESPAIVAPPAERSAPIPRNHPVRDKADEKKGARAASEPASGPRRIDAHHEAVPAPHFSLDAALTKSRRPPGRMEALWGQLLAYGGVGLLTVGTVFVLWGYFGGRASYAPTGWLMATAGQMLLFLGVVTLISGGMEQTTHEVAQRIEHLGDQLIRMERQASQHALRGPHFSLSESKSPTRTAEERT